MRTVKIILTVAFVLLVAFAVRSIVQDQRYKRAKIEWKETTAKRAKRIEALLQTITNRTASAIEWKEKAALTAVESAELVDLLKKERAEHKKDLAKVAILPADEIVIKTREYLQVAKAEIILNTYGIQFTIAAGRKNVGKLWLLDFTLKKEVPRLNEVILSKDKEITEVSTALNLAFEALDANSSAMIELRAQIEADKEILRECEKRVGMINFRDVALGAGATAIAVIVFAVILK